MTEQRRELKDSDMRCDPGKECPLQVSCARFLTPLPLGRGAPIANYSGEIRRGSWGLQPSCAQYLSRMVIVP